MRSVIQGGEGVIPLHGEPGLFGEGERMGTLGSIRVHGRSREPKNFLREDSGTIRGFD